MKNSLRGKIREFVQSEEGKVGIKSPLALGVATGTVLLAHAIVGTPQADACNGDAECGPGGKCVNIQCAPTSNGGQSCWGECA